SSFSNQFWERAKELNDPSFLTFLEGIKPALNRVEDGGEGEVGIYQPYYDDFPEVDPNEESDYYGPITTIVTATADADEGWGSQPCYINNVFQGYVDVLVNDDYAEENPTHIVGVNGVEPEFDTPEVQNVFPPGNP